MNLKGRNFLKEIDFTAEEFLGLIDLSEKMRIEKHIGQQQHRLAGRNIALIFEKASTRTRSAFEVAAHDEGAHVTYIGPGESQLGYKESMKDTARVLGRMYDGIEYRGSAQEIVETLGAWSGIPVWNGLTTEWHPTQMLADILTMTEHTVKHLSDIAYCYLGDARNNYHASASWVVEDLQRRAPGNALDPSIAPLSMYVKIRRLVGASSPARTAKFLSTAGFVR